MENDSLPTQTGREQRRVLVCPRWPRDLLGQLIITKMTAQRWLDLTVTTTDGIAYCGAFSAPSYDGVTSAISTLGFQGVSGAGTIAFTDGLDASGNQANNPTLRLNGTLLFACTSGTAATRDWKERETEGSGGTSIITAHCRFSTIGWN